MAWDEAFTGTNKADLQAINNYMMGVKRNTPAAHKLWDDWRNFYANHKNDLVVTDATIQEASNRRNAFNLANAVDAKQRAVVRGQLATGMSREEMRGKTRVTDSAGNYNKKPGVTVLSSAKGTVPSGARPTIRKGARGDAVKAWQAIIGVKADGIFGAGTDRTTRAWQKQHGLVADGIVGTATWSAAFGAVADKQMSLETAAITPVTPIGESSKIGEVTPIQNIKRPVPVRVPGRPTPKKIPPPSAKIIDASEAPPVKTETPAAIVKAGMVPGLETWKKLSPVGKVGSVAGLSVVGWLLSKVIKP